MVVTGLSDQTVTNLSDKWLPISPISGYQRIRVDNPDHNDSSATELPDGSLHKSSYRPLHPSQSVQRGDTAYGLSLIHI